MKMMISNSQIGFIHKDSENIDKIYKNNEIIFEQGFERELTNVLPLTFNGIGKKLLDYRINGASGGVGDRTNNLFDKTKTNRKLSQAKNGDGTMNYTTTASNFFDYYIPVEPNTQYTVTDVRYAPSRIYFLKNDKTWIDRTELANGNAYPKSRVFTTPSNCYYIQFQESKTNMMNENTLMLNEGSTALPYEPYGYKVPVVCGGTTTNIYLDEPIEENESISLSDTEVDIPTINGTNILSVDTTVQPSNVYIKYKSKD